MSLKKLICSCCGGELVIKDDAHYLCPYCKAMYEKDNAEELQEMLSSYLEKDKLERLSNARRVLYDAAIKTQYPSEKKVVAAATNVLSINPDDYFAQVVSYSYEEDGYELANYLPNLELDNSTADQVYRWLMRDVTARQIGPISDFIQRHFEGKDLVNKLTKLEDEAEKEQEGYYLSSAPRDVFICYSSKDMPEVIHIIDILEENGYSCFAAFRNLRHGRGAKENYLREIEQAIDSCKMFIFLSSKNSRTPMCDAIKVELPYLIKLEDKPRFEYMLDKDDGHVAIIAKKIIKEAFPAQERVHDEETLVERVELIEKELKSPKKKKKDVDLDEFNKKQKALDEKLKALEEAEKARKESLVAEEKARKERQVEEAKKKEEERLAEQKARQEAEERRLKELEERLSKQLEEKYRQEPETVVATEAKKKAPASKVKKDLSDDFLKIGKFKDVNSNTIELGMYPQKEVKDISLLKKLDKQEEDENGFVYFEGQKYAKFNDNYYSYAPIRWIILSEKENDTYLTSELALDVVQFDKRGADYKESDLREFLKSSFKDEVRFDGFTLLPVNKEKDVIGLVDITNINSKKLVTDTKTNSELNLSSVTPSEYALEKWKANAPDKWKSNLNVFVFGKDYIGGSKDKLDVSAKKYYLGLRPIIRLKWTSTHLQEEILEAEIKAEEEKRKAEQKRREEEEAKRKAEEAAKQKEEYQRIADNITDKLGKFDIANDEVIFGISPTKEFKGNMHPYNSDHSLDYSLEKIIFTKFDFPSNHYFIYEPIHWYMSSYDKNKKELFLISKNAIYVGNYIYVDDINANLHTRFPFNGPKVNSMSYPSKSEIKKIPAGFGTSDYVNCLIEINKKKNPNAGAHDFILSDVRIEDPYSFPHQKRYLTFCYADGNIQEYSSTLDYKYKWIHLVRLMIKVTLEDKYIPIVEEYFDKQKAIEEKKAATEAKKAAAKKARAEAKAKAEEEAKQKLIEENKNKRIQDEKNRKEALSKGGFEVLDNGNFIKLGLFPTNKSVITFTPETSESVVYDDYNSQGSIFGTGLKSKYFYRKIYGNTFVFFRLDKKTDFTYTLNVFAPNPIYWRCIGEPVKGIKRYISMKLFVNTVIFKTNADKDAFFEKIYKTFDKFVLLDKSKLLYNKKTCSYSFLPSKEDIEKFNLTNVNSELAAKMELNEIIDVNNGIISPKEWISIYSPTLSNKFLSKSRSYFYTHLFKNDREVTERDVGESKHYVIRLCIDVKI